MPYRHSPYAESFSIVLLKHDTLYHCGHLIIDHA